MLQANLLPMLRYTIHPFYPRGFKADVRIEATGDGAEYDRLLLFVQQVDEPPLDANVTPDTSVHVVEEAGNEPLLLRWRTWHLKIVEIVGV